MLSAGGFDRGWWNGGSARGSKQIKVRDRQAVHEPKLALTPAGAAPVTSSHQRSHNPATHMPAHL
jgi:hypothetical protein